MTFVLKSDPLDEFDGSFVFRSDCCCDPVQSEGSEAELDHGPGGVAGVMGLRFGEAAALRLSDIDPVRAEVSVTRSLVEHNGRLSFGSPKTTAGIRSFVMPRQLVGEIEAHLALVGLSGPGELLFADRFGGPIRRSNFRRNVFDPAVRSVGLDGLTLRGLRHSAATQWVKDGIDVRTVQHRLGHADPRPVVKLYAHASSDADSAAAEITARSYWPADDHA